MSAQSPLLETPEKWGVYIRQDCKVRDLVRILVIGAGLSGCVAAEQFATSGHAVTVFEKNSHVAGHAYDYRDEQGAMVHAYGPHLFHTNDMGVVEYLSKFTAWLPHEHKMLSSVNGKLDGWELYLDGVLLQDKLSTDICAYARIGLIAELKEAKHDT